MAESKIRLAVLFGGPSGEREVSRRSAASILANLDRRRYHVVPIDIGRDGYWQVENDYPELAGKNIDDVLAWMGSTFQAGRRRVSLARSIAAGIEQLGDVDVAFPALHGPYGEDGTLQGLLKALGIVFVGSDVLASALSMDKDYTKRILADAGLTVAPGVVLNPGDDDVLPADRERLGLPVFVKPAREGSSIGVSKVEDWADLPAALATARLNDGKVLVESSVPGREVDIGVLERPGGELSVSPPMEILVSDDYTFFDYTAKYDDRKTVLDVPATLEADITARLGEQATTAFRALGCAGLLRVDFFLRPDGELVVNEVNTFPGFTSASQYPAMWRAAGLDFGSLLDILVDTARWRAGVLKETQPE